MRIITTGARGFRETGQLQRLWRMILVAVLVAVWFVLAITGCTSDQSNLVGTGLVNSELDVMLDTLLAADVMQYTGKNISEADLPMASQELLYLGSQGGSSSSILVNYDFSVDYSDSIPEEAWAQSNISWVKLQMHMASFYRGSEEVEEDPVKALGKYYEVLQLDAPFDSTAFPGPVPPHDDTDLNIDPGLDTSGEIQIELAVSFFLNWVQNGQLQGILIQEGNESEAGFSGFAARDNRHMGSQFEALAVGTTQGPALRIQFVEPDIILSIKPVADTSTFHVVAPPVEDPADGFMMRTCLRSYPVLRFDLAALPENVYINRAVLYVVNDTTSSFGTLESVVVSEFDMARFGVHGDELPLADLELATYTITGMTSLDPLYHEVMQFNVTSAIQRHVNEVFDGEKGFILTAGEDFFSNFDVSSVDPDFYYNQFNFFGTSAPDSLRPQLRITYSAIDELTGGGE